MSSSQSSATFASRDHVVLIMDTRGRKSKFEVKRALERIFDDSQSEEEDR